MLKNPDLIRSGQYWPIESRAVAITKSIPSIVDMVETGGYYVNGDGGGAIYNRAIAEPSHAGKFQDASESWFELAKQNITLKMFGAVSDGVTDTTAIFNNAIDYAMLQQVVLDVTGNYGFNGEIFRALTNHLRMKTIAPSSFINRATAHTRRFFWFDANSFDFELNAANYLVISGNDLRNTIIRIENDRDTFPNCSLSGIIAKDAQVIVASGGDVNGIVVIGAFDRTSFIDCEVQNISMTAGTQGRVNQGFVVARTTFNRGPNHIYMRRVAARNVTSPNYQDSGYGDIDGFVLYQNQVFGASFDVKGITAENCARRGIKTQLISEIATLKDVYILRNTPSVASIGTVDIAIQYYQCDLENIIVEYGGDSIHQNGTTVLNISHPGTGLTPIPNGLPYANVDGVSVTDRSATKVPITYLFNMAYSGSDDNSRILNANNIKVNGNTINSIFSINSLGQDCDAVLNLSNVLLNMDSLANNSCMLRGVGNLRRLVVNLLNFRNLSGEEVPLIKDYSNVTKINNRGNWNDNGGNIGIVTAKGRRDDPNGGIKSNNRARGNLINNSDAFVTIKGYSGVSTAETYFVPIGTDRSFGNYGFANNNALIIVASSSVNPPGIYRIGVGLAIDAVSANASIGLGANDGTIPTAGQIRMWIDPSTRNLMVRAASDNYYISVYAFTG